MLRMARVRQQRPQDLQRARIVAAALAPVARLQQASAQLEKPARLRTLRKDIARVETQISALNNKASK